MLTVRPLDPEMAATMAVQSVQGGGMSVEMLRALAKDSPAFMACDGDTVIAAAGIIPQWQGCAIAWSTLAGNIGGARMLAVHRAVRRYLDECGIRRVEMLVAMGHKKGVRWARMLGFECESLQHAKLPNGGDAWLFVRLKNG
jgi:hypothetical protein